MGGIAEVEINGKDAEIFLGYYGGTIKIGDKEYGEYDENPVGVKRAEMEKELNKYKKSEIIRLILDFVDAGREVY